MWWYILLLPRVLLGLFGLYLIVLRLAGTDEEQSKAQGFLESLSKRVRERDKPAITYHSSLMRVISEAMNSGFNKLFGDNFISLQAITVSISYAIATILLSLFALAIYARAGGKTNLLMMTTVYLTIGSFPSLIGLLTDRNHDKWKLVWQTICITLTVLLVVGPVCSWVLGLYWMGQSHLAGLLLLFCFSVLVAFALYTTFIAQMRWSFRLISTSTSIMRIVVICLINVLPITVFLGLFKLAMWKISSPSLNAPNVTSAESLKYLWQSWSFDLGFFIVILTITVFLFVVLFAISTAIFVLLGLLLVIHRISWPVIHRLFYGLQKNQIVVTGKFLPVIGIIFLVIAIGRYSWLLKLWDKMF